MEDSLRWQAPEYHHYKRSTDWFWAVGIITLCISILAFIFDNALFGVLILLSAGVLVFYVLHVPEDVDYEINKKGIVIGKELHPYLTIEAFWIETGNNIESKIILKSKKSLLPYIIIPVHNDSADEVALVLRNFLEEKELSEPMAHKVMEYLGF